jgi:UDP-N-acetyl-D-mannosaminuronic acid dehydrogenase
MDESGPNLDLVVVGGCGRAGLPLALSLADVGYRVGVYDTGADRIASVRSGSMPFLEQGADELLSSVLAAGRLELDTDASIVARTDRLILVVDTPLDEFLNPSFHKIGAVIDELAPLMRPGSLVVLRSTVYPGTCERVQGRLADHGLDADVVVCPERIAEGHAVEELRTLPQIVGAADDRSFDLARELFDRLGIEVVRTGRREAELAKLLTNAWRYLKFAIANQFFEITHRAGLDYTEVLHVIRHHYPRAQDLPGPGFAAGPCLLKDTMQLAAFSPYHFPLGNAAMQINEGLPTYVVEQLEARRPLAGRTVGILGMAFKGDSDDARSSLSYKLKKLLAFRGARVLCTDPYVRDPDLLPLEKVLEDADILILATPHAAYRGLDVGGRDVVDVWGLTGSGISL